MTCVSQTGILCVWGGANAIVGDVVEDLAANMVDELRAQKRCKSGVSALFDPVPSEPLITVQSPDAILDNVGLEAKTASEIRQFVSFPYFPKKIKDHLCHCQTNEKIQYLRPGE